LLIKDSSLHRASTSTNFSKGGWRIMRSSDPLDLEQKLRYDIVYIARTFKLNKFNF